MRRDFRVTMLVTAEERNQLEAVAAVEERTMSQCARLALREWLSARERDGARPA
jgi:hypothetical protein